MKDLAKMVTEWWADAKYMAYTDEDTGLVFGYEIEDAPDFVKTAIDIVESFQGKKVKE